MAVHSRTKSLENNIKPLKNNSNLSDTPEIDIVVKETYKFNIGQLLFILAAIAAIVFFAVFLAKRNR